MDFGNGTFYAFKMTSSQQHPLSEPLPRTEYQGILFPGINWMFEIVHNVLGGKSENSSPVGPEFWPPGRQQPSYIQLRETPSPRLMVTHLPTQLAPPGLANPTTEVKVIVVLRNPKDVCVSSYYFRQKNRLEKTPESWEQFSKDFLDGKVQYGDYFDHVLGWWQKQDDPHFLFVKYEDMKKDFRSSVKTIAAFLEKELTDEDLARVLTNRSLESMRKKLAESDDWRKIIVRKGIVGDWKNHFSAEESARFDQKYREKMAGSGLEFEFE
ncbi:sulfotransferase 1B1-like isoform X2 [Branchiostoma lanceolatum]|uniref:sulfotransferase 1B1-like isoform X2 n=1 Tax=Branchiostoma lanceolatum TaxID=7740 RepID=UPI0034561AB2